MKQVVILIPGIMGSELTLHGKLIWPGTPAELVFPFRKMDELMDDELAATDIIRSFSISKQYEALIVDLAECGFHETGLSRTLFVCPYDWRRDLKLAARTLSNKIEEAFKLHKGEVEITLIAHSMGGLVSRYYLESREFDQQAGFATVRRLITLGTPHRGSPLALSAAMGMEKRLFLSAEQVRKLASNNRFPSLYQLLPPTGEPFVWDEGKGSAYQSVNIYDTKIAEALTLVRENLEAAVAFHSKLDMAGRPASVRYFFFVGTRQTTISAIRILYTGNNYRVRRDELEDAGDGTVPSWSGALTGVQGQPVGGEHGTIYKNPDLRRTLAVLLGKEGVLASEDESVEVALRERVANPKKPVHVSLTFASGMSELDGELRIERANIDAAGRVTGFIPLEPYHPISYSGLKAEKLGLVLHAPNMKGIYRVAYYTTGRIAPAGSDELFVQEAVP